MQGRFEEAEEELSRVVGVYEKMGVSPVFMERCNAFRRQIDEKMKSQSQVTSGELGGGGGKFLETVLLLVSINSSCTES